MNPITIAITLDRMALNIRQYLAPELVHEQVDAAIKKAIEQTDFEADLLRYAKQEIETTLRRIASSAMREFETDFEQRREAARKAVQAILHLESE